MRLQYGSLWEITDRARVITLIGAGGKTTCLQELTREIYAAGYPVTATTTTKVYPDEKMTAWYQPDPPPCEINNSYFWYTEVDEGSGKWLGPSPSAVDEAILGDLQRSKRDLGQCYTKAALLEIEKGLLLRHWVIEGDGARERRLKCWASHEPQIPYRSDYGVLVLDGRLWGHVLKAEYVHRPELCMDLVDRLWTEESAWRYFLKSPVFWPQYQRLSWVILLNIHGQNDFHETSIILEALNCKGMEPVEQNLSLAKRPRRLRLAAGNVKEGRLQWFDLW